MIKGIGQSEWVRQRRGVYQDWGWDRVRLAATSLRELNPPAASEIPCHSSLNDCIQSGS